MKLLDDIKKLVLKRTSSIFGKDEAARKCYQRAKREDIEEIGKGSSYMSVELNSYDEPKYVNQHEEIDA